jgi:DNA-binding transcriptional MerR regulator
MEVKYSIIDLERLSGIKAHTIRMWEHRFGILNPSRINNNHRFYSNEDLKYILNISLLNSHGYRISKIAQMTQKEVFDEANLILFNQFDDKEQINALSIAMIDMNEEQFEHLINQCVKSAGFKHSIEQIIFPFLRRVGYMWQVGTIFPAQEHFMSNLIRQKMITAIATGNFQKKTHHKNFLLFLPERELHELSLLYLSYLINLHGHKVIYLGQAVPMEDLEMVFQLKKPDAIVSVLTQPMEQSMMHDFLVEIEKKFSNSKILLSGSQMFDQKYEQQISNRIIRFEDSGAFEKLIETI